MLRRFGWLYWALGLGFFLGRLRLENHSVEHIRKAAKDGTVVYIMYRRSFVDYLALNTVINQRRLPLAVWVNGITMFWWQPLVIAYKDLFSRLKSLFKQGIRPDPITSGWLTQTIVSGSPIAIFLAHQPRFGSPPADPLPALLEAQIRSKRPIFILPSLVIWNKTPETSMKPVRWFFLGNQERPTLFTRMSNLIAHSRGAFVQVGEPVMLQELIDRVEPERRARALRLLLRRYLRREAHSVRGPRLVPFSVMKRMVLNNQPMHELARVEAEQTGQTYSAVRRQMNKDYDLIAANFRSWTVPLANIILRPLWTRVYSGVDVRDEDLDKIRAAMRDGTAILIPCHKSHFDYVLLSWLLFNNDLITPHIVAGVNLNIWPISLLLRGAGAFFIKRNFSSERIFPAVFTRYLRELIRQGFPVEFFIEGGRTRSGKLLPPKQGVLSMVLDAAALRPNNKEVTLLPIAFAYEQVAEEHAYAKELAGAAKKKETLGQLIKARSVLRRRYGRVYLRVGEPLKCSSLVDPNDAVGEWSTRPAEQRHDVTLHTAKKIMHRIGQATVVLPSSLVACALLSHHRRGIRHSELLERTKRYRTLLSRHKAHEANSLRYFEQAIGEALARFRQVGLIDWLDDDGEPVWVMDVDKRITLEFYKNQILHYFVPVGFTCLAIRTQNKTRFSKKSLLADFNELLQLFSREFPFDPEADPQTLLETGLADLMEHGAIKRSSNAYSINETPRIAEIYGLFRSLLETYQVTLALAPECLERQNTTEALAKMIQFRGPPLLADGSLTRPEALSVVSLKNAIRAFVELGAFVNHPELNLEPQRHAQLLGFCKKLIDP